GPTAPVASARPLHAPRQHPSQHLSPHYRTRRTLFSSLSPDQLTDCRGDVQNSLIRVTVARNAPGIIAVQLGGYARHRVHDRALDTMSSAPTSAARPGTRLS